MLNKDMIVYKDERYTLELKDKDPYLTVGGKTYQLSCHPYEPCTYIREGERLVSVIHNAFDTSYVIEAFSKGETVTSISGKLYDAESFCTLIAFAADSLYDTDISYAESALAVKELKESGDGK